MWTAERRIAALDIGGTAVKSAVWQNERLNSVRETPTPVSSAGDLMDAAAEIIRNAETEARARLGNLMEEREHLEKDIEALKEEARAYKARFAELIDAARRVLDEASDLE